MSTGRRCRESKNIREVGAWGGSSASSACNAIWDQTIFVAVSDAETLENPCFEDEQSIAEALAKFDTILLAGDNFKI